ncbi:phage head completion protein [Clostridium botulinum]|uniref:phage head completion protein n=2 Tax=Clostridium botulinum TaxID=1491 RepID=UPI000773C9FA|nr:hypothetical protein [Clostridium botulinum]MBN3398150.1 phage head-tail adapter protein [Clostridium botulinum]MBN3413190.1 phage head-tail adapter protein [Clostridium botulinum]NFA25768.1 head-tail adaptor protein [Clostridium botulinum]
MLITNQLNQRAELWGMIEFKNELEETDIKEDRIKDLVYCNILPQSVVKTSTPVSEGYEYTHRFKVRLKSIENPKLDMFFIFKEQKFFFKYWEPDYKNNEFLYIFCELKLE